MKKLYLLLLSTFFACVFIPTMDAQGPGGVAPAAWYKADAQNTVFSDAGVTQATDNSNIQQWNEYLGAVHNLNQSTSARQPLFSDQTTLVNFNPTITISGPNDDYLEYQPATGVNIIDRTEGTLYVAGYLNVVGPAGIIGFDATMDYPGLHTSNNGQNNLLFFTGGPGYQGLSTNSFTDNNYFISGANWINGDGANSSYASSIVSLNGVRSSYNNTELQNAIINNASRDIRVGRDSNWGGMNGQVNEVIIFENALSMAEMDRVESYLAIKYGNTYAQGGSDYVNAAGATVWTADATYNQNIFGIARDDASELYQKQSKSTNQNQQLVIGAGSGLFNTNAANTNTLTNGQFLMVGDNGLAQSLTTPLVYSGGNGETNFRFESIWKVQNTNGVGQVTIAWPAGIDNLYAVQSSDETFDGSDNFTAMTGTVNINGVDYNTATLTLTNGQYFTFTGYAHAPGGVLSNLLMWHKADDGVTTPGQKDIWKDVSANGRDVFQPNNNANEPLLVTDAMYAADSKNYGFNFNPFYYFDGTNDFFYNENQVYFPTTDSPGSAYGVMMNADVGGWRTPYGWGDDDPNLVKGNDNYYITRDNGTAINEDVGANSLPAHIGGMSWRGATNGIYLNVNGQIYANETTNIGSIQSAVNFAIGSEGFGLTGNGSEVYQGGLPEVFAYSADHQNATGDEKQRINSYLAIKYGITLLDDAGTAVPDYLSSASVTVWDATTNASYNNNIFGITNDYLSDLHQKQSKSINAGQQLIIGAGGSLFDTNAANTNTLTNGQFLLVGDNGLAQKLTTPLVYSGGANGDTNFRFEAIWKAQNTNSVGTVTVAWPKGVNNLYLVQSSDETFTNTDTFTSMATEVTINGVVYNTVTVTLADGQYFTLAGFQYAPGGVTSAAWYRADAVSTMFTDSGTTPVTDGTSIQQWNEFNNKPFPLSQTVNPSYRPDFSDATTLVNFNPTVTYTGGQKWLQYDGNVDGNMIDRSSGALFSAGSTTSQAPFIGFGVSGAGNAMDDPGLYRFNPDKLLFYPRLGEYDPVSTYTIDGPFIGGGTWENGAGTDGNNLVDITLGGYHETFDNAITDVRLDANRNAFMVGKADAGYQLDGQQNEMIVFDSKLSTDELNRVESYLAIKYGQTLSVDQNRNYLSSTSTVVWDGADANYYNNVFGIARDNISALYQKQSKSSNAGQQLIIGAGTSGLANTNAANTNTLSDGQFLLVGDNGLSQSLSESLVYTGGSNGEVNLRFAAIWKAQNTNGVGTVTVAWPGNVRNLYVVNSSDETFDGSDNFTEMTTDATINGVAYKTATISLADGEYFTFAGYGYAPAGVINNLSYWYRADKDADNTGDGTDVTSWTDFFSGTVTSQLGSLDLPKYAEGAANYFNFNPGINFTAVNQSLANLNVQTLSSTNFDIFTLTKEGLTNTGGNAYSRIFSIGMDNTTFNGTNWDSPGLIYNGNYISRNNTGGAPTGAASVGGVVFDANIPSIMYRYNTDTFVNQGLNGAENGSDLTFSARGQMIGGHIFGEQRDAGTANGDDPGFIGNLGETIVYGAGNLTTEERRRVDSYLAIKYGITLDRVDTDHYLGSTASATSIIWDGADNTAFNNNIFGMARADIGGFEQKVSKSVNAGTILTLATDDDYTASNMDASRTSFTNNEAYILFGDNEATGESSLATDPCTGETLNPALITTNRVWRVQNTNATDAVWLQADLSAYTFNSEIEIWIANDDAFTTNLIRVPAASYAAGIASFKAKFPKDAVRYIKFAGVVGASNCDVCTGGNFIFRTGRSWDTLAERTNNVIDQENIGSTDQGILYVDMDVADPANVEYGPNSTPRAYGRWMISRRYDNQNVALTHTIELNQDVAAASFQISNINTYLDNANKFTIKGYDCDGNEVAPIITDAYPRSATTTYDINGNEVVGTKPYRGLTSLYSTANVRFNKSINKIEIIAEVNRNNTKNTLRSLNIGDISFECMVALPPNEDGVNIVQDFTQSEDVPTCMDTTMRLRIVNSSCEDRTINISQTLPAGLEFVDDTYNDSDFGAGTTAYTHNASTFTLNGLVVPAGTTNYLYVNVRSTAGTTTTYNTSSSYTVTSGSGNTYSSVDPAANPDSEVSFEASTYTTPDVTINYTTSETCLESGTPATYTVEFTNNSGSAITGATLQGFYALGQEISSVTLNNGITGTQEIGAAGDSYIEYSNVTIPTGTSSIDVVLDITSDIFTDAPTASSVFQLITAPGNACAEENPIVSNVLTLEQCTVDPDLCVEEVAGNTFSSEGGVPVTFNQPATNFGFQFDIYTLDNSFNMDINGVQLATQEIQFQSAGTSGINVRFVDGDEYETNTAAIWQMTGNASAPLIRVVIAPNGDVSMYGSKTSGGALHPLELFNGNSFNSIVWNDGAPNTIVATQSVVGTTYISGYGSGLNKIPCPYCTQPGATGTPTEFTKTGISDRDGAVGTWPGNVPNGFIAIQSTDQGFVITRLTTVQIDALNAVEGMLVYDTDEQCVKLYNGTVWKCIERSCNN